jgi:hypothetical protein
MWLGIIALADKIFGILGALTGFWIKRSDESKKKRDEAQKEMNDAVKANDNDAYWNAKSRRDRV